MSTITHNGWTLVHTKTGKPVKKNEVVLDFRGNAETILGGRAPHKPESSGFVQTSSGEFYPSCYDLEWVEGA